MFLPILICVVLILIDRITKIIVSSNMDINTSIPVIKGFFHITYVENDGAAFSMLSGARWFFVVLTLIITVAAIVYYIKIQGTKYCKLTRFSLLMIISGAIGNFIDRLLYGSVTDMLHFIFGSYSFAVFNFADICVCCGTALLVFILIFLGKDDVSGEN